MQRGTVCPWGSVVETNKKKQRKVWEAGWEPGPSEAQMPRQDGLMRLMVPQPNPTTPATPHLQQLTSLLLAVLL